MSTADCSGQQPESQAEPGKTGEASEVGEQRRSSPTLRQRMGKKAAEGIAEGVGEAAGKSLAGRALEWILGQL